MVVGSIKKCFKCGESFHAGCMIEIPPTCDNCKKHVCDRCGGALIVPSDKEEAWCDLCEVNIGHGVDFEHINKYLKN